MITPSNAFDPQITSGGLSLNVQPGSVSINGVVTLIAQTAVTLVANSTNYVYVDLTALSVTSNTTGFPAYCLPVATVVTLTSSIQSVVDNRADVDLTSGGPLSPASTLNAAAQPTFRQIDSEVTLGYAGTTTVSGSVAAVRGNTTLSAATTLGVGSFLYGTQGKLTIKGTMSSGADVSCGLLGQLDLSSALAVSAPIAAIWGDCGASTGTVTAADIDVCVLYNTTATKINSVIRVAANASFLFDLANVTNTFFVGTTGTTAGGCVAVKTSAGTRYIQLFTTAS